MSKRNLQKERQQRGESFQDELRRSWRLLPNVWRFRIPDGGGGNRPGDEIVLLENINVLAEHKRTQSDKFQLSYLRPSQLKGLLDFDQVIERNYGMVFVNFHNEAKGRDVVYGFRLISAIHFMGNKGRRYITLQEFMSQEIKSVEIPLLPSDDGKRRYDLEELLTCYKSL